MLKHEEPEQQYRQADIPIKAALHDEAPERLMLPLAAQERAQAYIDRQQTYADKLIATVQTEARKFRRGQAVIRNLAIAFGLMIGLFVLIFVAHGLVQGKWDWNMLSSMGSMTGILSMAAVSSKTYKSAASELSTIEELRAVGPLAECLDIEEKTIRAQVEEALTRLLPRLQASDADLLNAQQRARLNKALQGKNGDLIIAILRAYEQVGDEIALPYVEALARPMLNDSASAQSTGIRERSLQAVLGPKAYASLPVSVTHAAQACLPALRVRVEQHRASQTLLRGSSAIPVAHDTLLRAADMPTTAGDVLLRPAQPTRNSAEPQQLLRSSDSNAQ